MSLVFLSQAPSAGQTALEQSEQRIVRRVLKDFEYIALRTRDVQPLEDDIE